MRPARWLSFALASALGFVAPRATCQLRDPPPPRVAIEGESMGTAVIVTPAAAKLGFVAPPVPADPVHFPAGTIGLRFGTALLVGSALEACAAWAYLNGPEPRFHGYLSFVHVDDLAMRDVGPRQVADLSADAHKRLKVQGTGWTLVCWNCTGPDMMTGLQALGGKPMTPLEAQRAASDR